jgi:hypothetical protein
MKTLAVRSRISQALENITSLTADCEATEDNVCTVYRSQVETMVDEAYAFGNDHRKVDQLTVPLFDLMDKKDGKDRMIRLGGNYDPTRKIADLVLKADKNQDDELSDEELTNAPDIVKRAATAWVDFFNWWGETGYTTTNLETSWAEQEAKRIALDNEQ